MPRILMWPSNHPAYDYGIAATLLGTHLAIIRWLHAGDFLIWLESDRRADLYAQAAATVATLGGLAAIGLAIYQSAGGGRGRALRTIYGGELRRNWRSLLVMAGLSAFLSFTAMSLDHDGDPLRARFIFEFAMAFAVVRFFRLLWIFGRVLDVADQDLVDVPAAENSSVSPQW